MVGNFSEEKKNCIWKGVICLNQQATINMISIKKKCIKMKREKEITAIKNGHSVLNKGKCFIKL